MDAPVSKHFSAYELSCRCGCGKMPLQRFVTKLDEIREAYGQPIAVSNVSRCQYHNDNMKPKGAQHSAHIEGIAADLVFTPDLRRYLIENLDRFQIWMENPLNTSSWIHVDLRPRSGHRIFNP